jgi:hypothetical protein
VDAHAPSISAACSTPPGGQPSHRPAACPARRVFARWHAVPWQSWIGPDTLAPGSTRGEVRVHVRVVRFTDVTAERMDGLMARVEESAGPPPGVPAKGLQILFDESQGTAVVLQLFDSAEDMRTGGQVFAAMDPSETPGTRASVDMCEMKLERHL